MKSATVSELRDHLSEFLRDVEAGERIRVLRRDHVIAVLGPPQADLTPDGDRLDALVRAGVVRRGSAPLPSWLDEVAAAPGDALLAALLADREEGR